MPHLTLLQSEVPQKPLKYHCPIHGGYSRYVIVDIVLFTNTQTMTGNKQVSTNSVLTIEQHFLKVFFDCVG